MIIIYLPFHQSYIFSQSKVNFQLNVHNVLTNEKCDRWPIVLCFSSVRLKIFFRFGYTSKIPTELRRLYSCCLSSKPNFGLFGVVFVRISCVLSPKFYITQSVRGEEEKEKEEEEKVELCVCFCIEVATRRTCVRVRLYCDAESASIRSDPAEVQNVTPLKWAKKFGKR